MAHSGGRFDFDDGGTYCGGWQSGKAHGHGVCTGPSGQGEFSGSWSHGFEVIGVYTWPSGNTYSGNWLVGKRHGLGVETKGIWEYKGEWSHGYKGRYGIRSNTTNRTRYEGTWGKGLQDGYGTETYEDGGTYEGQWMDGKRHGYGIRRSAPYDVAISGNNGLASSTVTSVHDASGMLESPGGFVTCTNSKRCSLLQSYEKKKSIFRGRSFDLTKSVFSGLKLRSKSTYSLRPKLSRENSVVSAKSCISDSSNQSSGSKFESALYGNIHHLSLPIAAHKPDEKMPGNTVEIYEGEWKKDKREGYGVCQRTDGYNYQGHWVGNYRHGYGCTKFSNGTKEEGKYKENLLIFNKKWGLLGMKRGKMVGKVQIAVRHANQAKKIARMKAEIASSRTSFGIEKAEQAEITAENAKEEAKVARCAARDLDPNFEQPGVKYPMKGETHFQDKNGRTLAQQIQNMTTSGVNEERRKLPFWKHPHYISAKSPIQEDISKTVAQCTSSTLTDIEKMKNEDSASTTTMTSLISRRKQDTDLSERLEGMLNKFTSDQSGKNVESPDKTTNTEMKTNSFINNTNTARVIESDGSVEKPTSLELYLSTYESGMIPSLEKTSHHFNRIRSKALPNMKSEKITRVMHSEYETLGLNQQLLFPIEVSSGFAKETNDVYSAHGRDLKRKNTSSTRNVKNDMETVDKGIKKYSPLPVKLRSGVKSVDSRITSVNLNTVDPNSGSIDTKRVFLIILAIILNLGFAALSYQFQFSS